MASPVEPIIFLACKAGFFVGELNKCMNDKLKEQLEAEGIEAVKASWPMGLLLRFAPFWAMKIMQRKTGVKNDFFDKAHELFSRTKTIDIVPVAGSLRGFILILDRNTALYFYQDGGHFKYDGFEMGEYEKGDVTIFDNLKI
ncbi:hypothetical protein KKB41_00135 [Patescibacteria group bacterium]|nr:hypothetical protein [Patescibacteria group bacterium]